MWPHFQVPAKQVMKTKPSEAIRLLSDPDFLDKLFGFAYRRCSTSHEAEDLCSEMILSILKALRQQEDIDHFHAFSWTVARRVYADYCERRRIDQASMVECPDAFENLSSPLHDELIREAEDAERLEQILREITFLSQIYRDVMVMYYLEDKKISAIAKTLGISETTVKQRLFFARNTVQKGVKRMEHKNYTLQPIQLQFIGTGKPIGNDPRVKAERLLSQNLVYLCRKEEKSARELSDALGVPMPYVEEELEIQLHGENGQYGLLQKTERGKYIANILIADVPEYDEANRIYEKHLKAICEVLKKTVEASREKILSFPFLSHQDDPAFVLWPLISRLSWNLAGQVCDRLTSDCFSEVPVPEREFTTVAVAARSNEMCNIGFYGQDGITAKHLCGYSEVFASNMYSDRIDPHFRCGHNISTDPLLILTLRAIGGLEMAVLTEEERETAAKAIECGYLRKAGSRLEPKILVFEQENGAAFEGLLSDFVPAAQPIATDIAKELAEFLRRRIPKHLMGEYRMYNSLIASGRLLHAMVEQCIQDRLLSVPEQRLCAEGVILMVKK